MGRTKKNNKKLNNQSTSAKRTPISLKEAQAPLQHHMRFFASIKLPRAAIESKTTLSSHAVLGINITLEELKNEKDLIDFQTQGIKLEAPGGLEYTFKMKDNIPQAILTEPQNILPFTDEEQKKRALTILNMIENVLSKSITIKIETTDPFIAKIANNYIKYLQQDGVELDIHDTSPAKPPQEPTLIEQNADTIFIALTNSIDKNELKKAPWFIDAQHMRETVQQVSLQHSRISGIP